ncbi:258_t:CDS:2, partial [Funneliformis geosporum]
MESNRFFTVSIVFVNSFEKKEEEHRMYKICLEKLTKSPYLFNSCDSESIQLLASQLKSRKVPCCSSVINCLKCYVESEFPIVESKIPGLRPIGIIALKRKSHLTDLESNIEHYNEDKDEYDVGLLERVEGELQFQEEADIFNTPKIEMLASINMKSHLKKYNIVCLFDIEFPYTKQFFMKLTDQMHIME